MSDDPAAYTFVPWVRQGFRPSDTGTTGTVGVSLTVTGAGEKTTEEPAQTTLALYGPGEVTGVDRRQVVMTQPAAGTTSFPPNYFPTVAFDRPDMPWLFSPETPDDDGRLRPWLCLVTVERGEGVSLTTDAETAAAVLELTPPASAADQLPDLSESWAWAHAQEVGATDTATALADDDAVTTLSRLVSPRALAPNTDYYACVVPTFEPGRRAGLGKEPYDGPDRAIADAWDTTTGTIRLPVYYHWTFSTGGAGDFESLVRRLDPETLTDVGIRTVDAGDPGPDSLAQPGETVTVEGALRSTDLSPDPYDPGLRSTLEEILDASNALTAAGPTDIDDIPLVGPPTYGQWPPAAKEVPAPGLNPVWLRDLNLDPRHRVPAAYGTRVVQEQQEQLMRNAWAQVGDVRKANQLLARARLAREASRGLHDNIAGLDDTTALSMTEPLFGRTTDDTRTFADRIESSAFPVATLSPAFRRTTRPTGPLARRFGGLSPATLVERVADGQVTPGDDTSAADGAQTLDAELATRLCTSARKRGRSVDAWHPLGSFAGQRPTTALPVVREACTEFRVRGRELRAEFESSAVAPLLDPFIEPLMGVCGLPDEEFQSDLDTLGNALTTRSWSAVDKVFRRILDAVDQSLEGHADIEAAAASNQSLAAALTTDPGVTPAYEQFLDALRRLILLVYDELLGHHCRRAQEPLKALIAERDSEAVDELRVVCHAICGDERGTGGLVERLTKQLLAGQTRPLRRSYHALTQLVAMAQARIEHLTATTEGVDPALTELADHCDAVERYADVLGARLAEAPWNPAADAVGSSVCPAPEPTDAPALDVPTFVADLVSATRPSRTLTARLADRLGGVDLTTRPDTLDQILAHPEFPQPMYEALYDLSQEYLLPGVGTIPMNCVGVLETNPAFVEAFLLGLSHEFARELRWRAYPTDLRGTYFRQFWDPEGQDPPLPAETKKDIDYVHRWNDSLGLGGNNAAKMAAKTAGGSGSVGGQLVLVVRGEVFDRYPNTNVYAARGRSGEDDEPPRVPDLPDPGTTSGEVKHPMFRGRLDPDITFFGFDLTEAEAAADPGWFFVVEEPPSEPSFGFDVAVDDPDGTGTWGWEDLTWADVSANSYLSVTTPPDVDVPDPLPSPPTWGRNSAHMAEIAWQRPFRVAIHADDMLPTGGQS